MTEHIQHVEEQQVDPIDNTVRTTEVTDRVDTARERAHTQNVAARTIDYITNVLLALLAIRFVLALLGANPSNGFANLIYSVTYPFVYPFFSLFNYNLSYRVSHFESYTLVAIAVYALVGYALARLITITRR